MKTLSLWQPWASAIAAGLKRNETRSWFTPYRGPLAIHAAKTSNKYLKEFFAEALEHAEDAAAFARIGIRSWEDLPLGKVVATAGLIDCQRTELLTIAVGSAEYAWGNYSPGRFAWMLAAAVPLAEPVPAVGCQGLWEWSGGLA